MSPEVTITDAVGDPESPARLTIKWRNETDDTVTLNGKWSMVFTAQTTEDGNVHLLGDAGVWSVDFDGCWHMTGPIGTDGACPTVTVEPGGVHDGTSGVYASDESCLSSGEYRFEVSILEHDSPDERNVTDWWGFVLDVTTAG